MRSKYVILFFRDNDGYAKATQHYVIRTLPILYCIIIRYVTPQTSQVIKVKRQQEKFQRNYYVNICIQISLASSILKSNCSLRTHCLEVVKCNLNDFIQTMREMWLAS
jgi:hypothetical protein